VAERFDPSLFYGRSDFGEAETRLRRLLSLEGLIPMDLSRSIQPVMLVGDGTLPGMSQARLRRFTVSSITTGVSTGFWLKANNEAGVVIDAIELTVSAAAAALRIRYLGATDTDPLAIATPVGVMVDRAPSGSEVSPLLRNAAADASAFNNGGLLVDMLNMPIGRHFWSQGVLCPFYLATGAKFSLAMGNAQTWTVYGRTF